MMKLRADHLLCLGWSHLALIILSAVSVTAEETKVYQSNFGEFIEQEKWSETRTEVFPGKDRPFLGKFGDQEAVALNLRDLPDHKLMRIKVSLFAIGGLDGNFVRYGPDLWGLSVDGDMVFNTDFANSPTGSDGIPHLQSFPDEYPYGNNRARTGASEKDTLGVADLSHGSNKNSVYQLEFVVSHTRQDVEIWFGGDIKEDRVDESWGLESVEVSTLSEPASKTPEEMEALLGDMGGLNPMKAHRAVWAMAETGASGIKFLTKRKKELVESPDGLLPLVESRIDTVLRVGSISDQEFQVRSSAATLITPRLACDGEHGKPLLQFRWPDYPTGTREWLEYRFPEPRKISKASVFWWVGKPDEVSQPEKWHVEYLDAEGNWQPVENADEYPTGFKQWCEASFDPVTTSGLRLVIKMKKWKSAGLSEFRFGFEEKPAAIEGDAEPEPDAEATDENDAE